MTGMKTLIRKDRSLDALAASGFNVAQFVAYEPTPDGPVQTYSRVNGHEANAAFPSLSGAITALLAKAPDGTVNVRSYSPEDPQSREFIVGIESATVAAAHVRRLTEEGLHTIVNETVDLHDGGVSGVICGETVEFSPDDTPRCVEKPGTTTLPLDIAVNILCTVYGDDFAGLATKMSQGRTEFSLHPKPRGWLNSKMLVWEHDADAPRMPAPEINPWPHNFSRLIGDKTYGVMVANALGARVPQTTVMSRRVAPFSFGQRTDTGESWVRTAPVVQRPGLFTTVRGWTDPFALLAKEDPEGTDIASVLVQDGVTPCWSGALVVGPDMVPRVEGCRGAGDDFMLGRKHGQGLPGVIMQDVIRQYDALSRVLGPVRLEWVHDGQQVWIVQMHRGATVSSGRTIVPGEAADWREFTVADGLPALRALLAALPAETGVVLKGDVGLTSHVADVLRKAGRPARIG